MNSTRLNFRSTLDDVVNEVVDEVDRANHLHGEQSIAGQWHFESDRLAILSEEVGEVAHEVNERRLGTLTSDEYDKQVYVELVQVAAMAVAWAAVIRPGRQP